MLFQYCSVKSPHISTEKKVSRIEVIKLNSWHLQTKVYQCWYCIVCFLPMDLSNHKWQGNCYLSVDTFQMEHMEATSMHPTPYYPYPPVRPTNPTHTTLYHLPPITPYPPQGPHRTWSFSSHGNIMGFLNFVKYHGKMITSLENRIFSCC